MNNSEYLNLIDDIKNIKKENIEEIILITKYCLNTYINSVIVFGFNSKVTQDITNVLKEVINIIKEEHNMLNFLKEYTKDSNVNEVNNFIIELDILNEETIQYYYHVLDGIEDACDIELEWKANRPVKHFKSLIDSYDYHKKLYGLILSTEDIKKFFNYPKEFWNYIDKKTYLLDSRLEQNKDFYGVNMKLNEEKYLTDIKIFIPEIINLETALINVHEIKHAYDLYERLGKIIDKDELEYEETSKKYEQNFKERYLVKRYQQTFNKN